MSHPDPRHDPENVREHDSVNAKKAKVASKMPYLGNASPRKDEPFSKSAKRFSRYLKAAPSSSFDPKAVAKSARRHRHKEGLPF